MQIVGILFCLAGLITSIGALVGGDILRNTAIPIAMMFVCIGLMFTTVGGRN